MLRMTTRKMHRAAFVAAALLVHGGQLQTARAADITPEEVGKIAERQ